MSRGNNNDNKRKRNNNAFSSFVCGFLVCFVIMAGIYFAYRHFHQPDISYRLLGGWILSTEDISEKEQTAPRILDFHEDRVDIITVGGNEISCSYTVSSDPLERIIVIYDFYGEDIELEYSIQPIIHILGVGDAEGLWGGEYFYAG